MRARINVAAVIMIGLGLAPCSSLNAASKLSSQRMGKLKGVVLDPIDARVVQATITIRAEGFKRKIYVDQNLAEFEAEVPVGSYELYSEAPGFKSDTRVLRIEADELAFLTIHLLPEPGFPPPILGLPFQRLEPQDAPLELGRAISARKLD